MFKVKGILLMIVFILSVIFMNTGFCNADNSDVVTVFDNFDGTNMTNGWGITYLADNVYTISTVTDTACNGIGSLKVIYNKGNLTYPFFNTVASDLGNLTFANTFRMKVKADQNVSILVKFNLVNGGYYEYTQEFTACSSWQDYTWDISGIKQCLSEVTNVMIFIDPGVTGTVGTLYLDDIEFVGAPINYSDIVTIDNFDGVSSTSDWLSNDTDVYALTNVSTPWDPNPTTVNSGTISKRIDYNKGSLTYPYFYARVNPPGDFSAYKKFRMKVYGNANLIVKFETSTGTYEKALNLTGGNTWRQEFSWDLSQYQSGSLVNIQRILIFVDPGISGTSGTFYIDNLEFVNYPNSPKKALTWTKISHDDALGIDLVGTSGGNPYIGDTPIDAILPVLAIKIENLPRPNYAVTGSAYAMPKEYYQGWAGGHIALTPPIRGSQLTSLAVANEYCRQTCGDGYRMAEFHDGKYVVGMDLNQYYGATWPGSNSCLLTGGWNFYAYGNIATNTRFWVYINDQPANCW